MIDWRAKALELIGGICWTQHCDDKDCKCQKDVAAALVEAAAAGRSPEDQMLAFEWMRAHDKLLSFIQARPEWLKELIDNDPRDKMPSPADLPNAIAEAEKRGWQRGHSAATAANPGSRSYA